MPPLPAIAGAARYEPPARGTASEMPPKSDAVVKDAFPEGLQRGDLVFAKIYGFPWWPAVVRGVRHAYEPEDGEEPTVRVRFCADPTNYHATPSTLERFADKPEWTDVKTVTWKFKSPTLRKKWEVSGAEHRTLAVAVAVAVTLTVALTLSPNPSPNPNPKPNPNPNPKLHPNPWEAALAEAKAYSREAEAEWSGDEEAKIEEGLKKTAEAWLTEGQP